MYSGIVVKGDGLATDTGFPTANIDCKLKSGAQVTTGVFAAQATIDNQKYNSALIITPKGNSYKFEVHVLDFKADLYGKYLEVDLIQKVSEIENYDSNEELLEKIKNDINMVKQVFAGEN